MTRTEQQAVRDQERNACTFCIVLQRLAIRWRDPMLLEAAIRLREVHAASDRNAHAVLESIS